MMGTIDAFPRVGPFLGVQKDTKIAFTLGRKRREFRIILYAWYDAHGLIGCESNGIAVLDEDHKQVLLDQEAAETTGYHGASNAQVKRFDAILDMNWVQFREWVNTHPRNRILLEDEVLSKPGKMPKFDPKKFHSTKFDTPDDKADFANALAQFILTGFQFNKFTKKLYQRLMHTFGHIAHYNQGGFYTEWFKTNEDRIRFLNHTLNYCRCGDPNYTWCDAEKAIQEWLQGTTVLEDLKGLVAQETEAKERAELQRLKEKYEPNHAR